MEYISTRLKTLMKQRGISRKKLASDLNLKQEAIDQYQDNFYTADSANRPTKIKEVNLIFRERPLLQGVFFVLKTKHKFTCSFLVP